MSEPFYPRLYVLAPPKADTADEDSFAGESPSDHWQRQVKLLEARVSELQRQLEVEKKAGDFREAEFRKALDERDAARAEVAEFLNWIGTEMEWEHFRAEMLYGKSPEGRISSQNAAKLGAFLKRSGRGSAFLEQLKKAGADLEAARAKENSGGVAPTAGGQASSGIPTAAGTGGRDPAVPSSEYLRGWSAGREAAAKVADEMDCCATASCDEDCWLLVRRGARIAHEVRALPLPAEPPPEMPPATPERWRDGWDEKLPGAAALAADCRKPTVDFDTNLLIETETGARYFCDAQELAEAFDKSALPAEPPAPEHARHGPQGCNAHGCRMGVVDGEWQVAHGPACPLAPTSIATETLHEARHELEYVHGFVLEHRRDHAGAQILERLNRAIDLLRPPALLDSKKAGGR